MRELELAGVSKSRRSGSATIAASSPRRTARRSLAAAGIDLAFVQDNHSLSKTPACFAGFTTSCRPSPRTSWSGSCAARSSTSRSTSGRARRRSARWVALEISAEKWNQILVPKGFAHGFVTLVPDTEVLYKVTERYARRIMTDRSGSTIRRSASTGRCLRLKITLSDKDRKAPLLADAEIFE